MIFSLFVSTLLVFAEISSAAIMTDSWAVKIRDPGTEEADALAKKHGFINQGLV